MLDIDNLINSAIENGWSLVIKYRKYSGEVSVRKISDIYYSDEFGEEYIDAYCHKREERRTFKINRILAAERANESSAFRQSSRPIVSDLGRRKVYSHSYLDSSRMTDLDRHTAEQSYRPSQNEGCYIATMAYGDYNHPQVIKLRKFRDDVLKTTVLGKCFVSFYYKISPWMVKLLKNNQTINLFIRNRLDALIFKLHI